jgi:F-type H+-transporting ATPase subunit delta
MRELQVAKRYARALLNLSDNESDWLRFERELKTLSDLFNDSGDFALLASLPSFGPAERASVCDALVKDLSLHESMGRFLHVLCERHRLGTLPYVAKAYSEELDHRVGRVRAQVVSAKPLGEQALASVMATLKKRAAQSNLLVEKEVDPALLGGMRVHIGGRVYDGTLETRLMALEQSLIRE